ncbi:MAG: type I methionyl aminopeptidase [Opitutales bacterium]|nr:type I methionyl aminopeptidase [Opitutales bacterium]
MIPIKSDRDLKIMREACAIAATVLDELCQIAKEGITTLEIDRAGKEIMSKYSCRSACYHYKAGRLRYPGYLCISVNDEVIHGIGSDRALKSGDIVSMDVSVIYKGFVGDNTRTVLIGDVNAETRKLVEATDIALQKGIEQARAGNRVGDISSAIQSYVESCGYGIVEEFTGHGVGRSMHEEPQIPNYGRAGTGPILRAGMTLAIEPMITMGSPEIFVGDDGWTVYTSDGKPSCHIEHTVLVTNGNPEILTIPMQNK